MEALNTEKVRQLVENHSSPYIKLGLFDIDGVLCGKYLNKKKFLKALDKGSGFCDVVLGWDIDDKLYDNTEFTGWHTGYPDAPIRIVPESMRTIPYDETLFFLSEFDGDAKTICPRQLLQRVIAKAEGMGFTPYSAFEYEFFIFNESQQSVREKHYSNLKPITEGMCGYSVLNTGVFSEFYQDLLKNCLQMDIELEGLHCETGPGVLEAAISVNNSLKSADDAALFKSFTKLTARQHQWIATFMARWSQEQAGQSGHIHVSLRDKENNSVFYDANSENGVSKIMRHFIAGQQLLMPEFCAMFAPTINSYARLVPGFWAPTTATAGLDNRTCALRVINGSPDAMRVEFRAAGADANPYLALSAALASGLYGIENQLEPENFVKGNAYEQEFADKYQLPANLTESYQRFKQSDIAKQLFGEEFVDHFSATRAWEVREANKAVTDWQLKRYFEQV